MEKWVREKYLCGGDIAKLREQCANATPFPHIVLKNFFREEKVREIKDILTCQTFEERKSDLFSFSQCMLEDSTLQKFVTFLGSVAFREWVSQVTGVDGLEKIDATGFCYADTDHLLPHRDDMPGRKVAYVMQLSEDFAEGDGGELELFDGEGVEASYRPQFNSLVLFPVEGASLHQVKEVIGEKKRYTITGWYYG